MTETTPYPRPLVCPVKHAIAESDTKDGFMTMEWTGEASDIVRLRWFSKDDTVDRAFRAGGFSSLRNIYWLMPPMRQKTANKILNAAADLIAEGHIREVHSALARIYVESGDLERHLGKRAKAAAANKSNNNEQEES